GGIEPAAIGADRVQELPGVRGRVPEPRRVEGGVAELLAAPRKHRHAAEVRDHEDRDNRPDGPVAEDLVEGAKHDLPQSSTKGTKSTKNTSAVVFVSFVSF